MAYKLEIPEGYDEKVINTWIGKSNVIFDEQGDSAYFVMVKRNGGPCFMRFFTIGDKTEVSVDFDSSMTDESLFQFLLRIFDK